MADIFNTRITVRVDSDIIAMLDKLEAGFIEKYENRSHVVRCAIIRLYRSEGLDNAKKLFRRGKKEKSG